MALDATAKEANVRDSLKKFFVDGIRSSYPVSFDRGMATPRIQGQPSEIDRWVGIDIGNIGQQVLSELWVRMYLCARKDNEGFRLAHMRDTVVELLSDSTQTDTMKRIDLYRSYESKAWEKIGTMLVQEVLESDNMEAPDDTKFKILNVRIRWGAKI